MSVRVAMAIATVFGVGRTPFAPGTAGSVVGLLLAAATSTLGPIPQIALAVLVVAIGAVAADVAARHHGEPDASWIVVDEVAGMLIAMIGVPFGPLAAVAGFVLFRLADVYKPFPCRWIDENVHNGLGTMLDDVFAGLWALAALHAAAWSGLL